MLSCAPTRVAMNRRVPRRGMMANLGSLMVPVMLVVTISSRKPSKMAVSRGSLTLDRLLNERLRFPSGRAMVPVPIMASDGERSTAWSTPMV